MERGGGEVGLEFLTSRDVQNIGDCTERSFKCLINFEKPYLKQFLLPKMLSLFPLYHSVRNLPMWQDI